MIAYADDEVISGEGIDNLKSAIKKQKEWTSENKMNLNEQKFLKKIGDKKVLNKYKNDEIEGIPIKKSYKYLGVMIDESLNYV